MLQKSMGWALALLFLAGCEGREVTFAAPLKPDASDGDGQMTGGAGGSADGAGGSDDGATTPVLSISRTALDFGPVPIGFAAPARLVFTNQGDESLPAPTISLSGTAASDFSVLQNDCSNGIASNGTCSLGVIFQAGEVGERTAVLELAVGSRFSFNVPLTGAGILLAEAILEPAPGSTTDFGRVDLGTERIQSFRLVNPGSLPLDGLELSLNEAAFTLPTPGAGECAPDASIAAGGSCDLRVRFAPEQRGLAQATLTALTADGSGVSLNLEGYGAAEAQLALATTRLNFGNVVQNTRSLLDISVTNGGDGELPPVSASLSGAHAAEFELALNGCTQPLVSSSSCNLSVAFTPAGLGARSAVLDVTAGSGGSARVELTGNALEPGGLILTAADGALVDFGPVVLADAKDQAFVLSNPLDEPSGALVVTVNSEDFSVLPASGADCDLESGLQTGGSCSLRVRFAPGARGQRNTTLNVTSARLGSVGLSLSGTGLSPAQIATEDGVDFGSIVVAESATRELDVTNPGDQALGSVQATLAGTHPNDFQITTNDCPEQLTSNARCTVAVTFRPTANGNRLATLLLEGQPGGTREVGLAGIGLAPGALTLAAAAGSSATFADQLLGSEQSQTQTFVLSNTGGSSSGVINVPALAAPFSILTPAGTDCVSNLTDLAAGATCTLRVQFSPASRGAAGATLTASSSRAGAVSLSLSGNGLAAAQLAVLPNQLTFNNPISVGQNASLDVTLRNQGDVAMGIPSASLSGPGAADFSLNTSDCATQLAASETCTLAVRFNPSASGARSATLRVQATPGGSLDVAVSGTGQLPGALVLEAAPGSADFGTLLVGASRIETFTLRNTGDLSAGRILSIALRTGFSRQTAAAGECNPGTTTLNGRASCTLRIRFQPAAPGSFEVSMNATSQSAGTASLTLRGVAQAPARLQAVQQLSIANATVVGQQSAAINWVVTNAGEVATQALSLTNSNQSEFLITNGCTGSLTPGSSCNVAVRYQPGGPGRRSTMLSLTGGANISASVSITGDAICPSNQQDDEGVCRLRNGQPCTTASQCAADACTTVFVDEDNDGFGDENAAPTTICGTATGYSVNNEDCCDIDALANPDQTTLQPVANACGNFDYDCSGEGDGDDVVYSCPSSPPCQSGWFTLPECGARGGQGICASATQSAGPGGGTVVRCIQVSPAADPSRTRRCK